jgi:hypothetical protein
VIPSTPTGALTYTPAVPTSAHDVLSATPTDELTHAPTVPASAPANLPSLAAGETLTEAPVFSLPTPEKRSTPRPVNMDQTATPLPLSSRKGPFTGRNRTLIVALIVVLVVLAGGAGAFALVRQHTSTSTSAQCSSQQASCTGGSPTNVHAKATSLTFSGTVTGPMSILAKPNCQSSTSGDLRTLMINLSGTLNDKLYNFGFTIQHYNGPGTYNNAAPDITILFDVPGDITNGWSNSDPSDSGTITVERGDQTGSISYTLSGTGTSAKTQIQVTGNWTCGG